MNSPLPCPIASAVERSLLHRLDPVRFPLTGVAQHWRAMNLVEMVRDYARLGQVNVSGLDRMDVAALAIREGGMGTLTDFPTILSNVANKRLRQAYGESPGTYRQWARKGPDLPDFKAANIVQLSAMPDLLRTNEHGSFTVGTVRDAGTSIQLLTYGRIVAFTRQAIVNDDLRSFDRAVLAFGQSAARLENRLVYSRLTANAAMGDGVPLFHATHANLGTGAGSALSAGALGSGRASMRRQRGLQLEELNLTPSYLLVPAALEQRAYQFTSAQYTPATVGEINESRQGGRTQLEPVVEPLLDNVSASAWYLTAASSAVDTVEYAYLEGADAPFIEAKRGFSVDGVQIKCRHDFATALVDYRGLYRADGA